jgi:hypothetical protein
MVRPPRVLRRVRELDADATGGLLPIAGDFPMLQVSPGAQEGHMRYPKD